MKLLKPLLCIALPLLIALNTKAQNTIKADTIKTDTSKADKKNLFNSSINYVSRLNYLGRVDSLKSSGFFPILSLDSRFGLYATTSFIFTQNSAQSLTYAGTSIEGGYKFPEGQHFSGNVFYTQFLYKPTATIVQSALKEQTGVNLTWKNDIINVTGGGDIKFSGNTDIGATGTLDHLFIIKITSMQKTAVALNPTATINAGSQKFAQTYVNKIGGILGGLGGVGSTTTTQNINKFNILSYEFSMPVVLVINRFYAALTPAYVIPENLIKVANRPDLSEMGENMFYVTATVGMRLEFR